jgi:holliday junction DNA helicase RuvA
MIEFLSGTVRHITDTGICLEVNNIGYGIILSPLSRENSIGSSSEWYIHTKIQDDQMLLFGFSTLKAKQFFLLLIQIPGIGPRLAQNILDIPVDILHNAILKQDITLSKHISGMGKKITARFLSECNEKDIPYLTTAEENTAAISNNVFMALENLGYKKAYIYEIFAQNENKISSDEEMIQWFLRQQ